MKNNIIYFFLIFSAIALLVIPVYGLFKIYGLLTASIYLALVVLFGRQSNQMESFFVIIKSLLCYYTVIVIIGLPSILAVLVTSPLLIHQFFKGDDERIIKF